MTDFQYGLDGEPQIPEWVLQARSISRKRSIDDTYIRGLSNDYLGFFPGDDLSSVLEDYQQARPKKQHQRPWWESNESAMLGPSIPVRQDDLSRCLESGDWMRDESAHGADDILKALVQDEAEQNKARKIAKLHDDLIRAMDLRAIDLSDIQWEALKQVDQAILHNNPVIDLGLMSLGSLPWEVLKPLKTFIPEPDSIASPLTPKLKIFLGQNGLSHVPSEIFTLKGLQVLSLRQNNLKELSPAVSLLASSLLDLNLSGNRLNFLPVEIKAALRRTYRPPLIHLTGNPFYEPVKNTKQAEEGIAVISKAKPVTRKPTLNPLTTHVSRITYMNARGLPINGAAPSKNPKAEPISDLLARQQPQGTNNVPSLYELAIRKTAEFQVDSTLRKLGKDVPDSTIANVKDAAEQSKAGFQSCSICKRPFSIARTEWIEWQSKLQVYQNVPLLHRGCSWSCVPDTEHLEPEAKNCGWIEGEAAKDTYTTNFFVVT